MGAVRGGKECNNYRQLPILKTSLRPCIGWLKCYLKEVVQGQGQPVNGHGDSRQLPMNLMACVTIGKTATAIASGCETEAHLIVLDDETELQHFVCNGIRC